MYQELCLGHFPRKRLRSLEMREQPYVSSQMCTCVSVIVQRITEHINFATFAAYLFWSIFTSLITTLFYFSVWRLALSGSELSLLCLLSPALLGIGPLRTWALTRSGRVTLRAVAILTGLGSYALNSPIRRLFVVNFANVVLLIGQTVDWSAGKDGYQGLREYQLRSVIVVTTNVA
jgi:hypothetical protein